MKSFPKLCSTERQSDATEGSVSDTSCNGRSQRVGFLEPSRRGPNRFTERWLAHSSSSERLRLAVDVREEPGTNTASSQISVARSRIHRISDRGWNGTLVTFGEGGHVAHPADCRCAEVPAVGRHSAIQVGRSG